MGGIMVVVGCASVVVLGASLVDTILMVVVVVGVGCGTMTTTKPCSRREVPNDE